MQKVPWSLIVRNHCNIVTMAIIIKLIYSFNPIPIKISNYVFLTILQADTYVQAEIQGIESVKIILIKIIKLDDLYFLLSKLTINLQYPRQCNIAIRRDIQITGIELRV